MALCARHRGGARRAEVDGRGWEAAAGATADARAREHARAGATMGEGFSGEWEADRVGEGSVRVDAGEGGKAEEWSTDTADQHEVITCACGGHGTSTRGEGVVRRRQGGWGAQRRRSARRHRRGHDGGDTAIPPPTVAPMPVGKAGARGGDDESEWEEWEATDDGGFRRVDAQGEAARGRKGGDGDGCGGCGECAPTRGRQRCSDVAELETNIEGGGTGGRGSGGPDGDDGGPSCKRGACDVSGCGCV